MLGRLIEHSVGQIVAPDPKIAPESTTSKPPPQSIDSDDSQQQQQQQQQQHPRTLMEIIAPDPKYYASLSSTPEDEQTPPPTINQPPSSSFHTPTRPSPPSTSTTPSLDNQVLNAAKGTAETLASPPLVWERRKNLFTICSHTAQLNPKKVKQLTKLLQKQPEFALLRCANMGILVPDGYTPLHAAAYSGNVEAAKVLLNLKIDGKPVVSNLTTDLQGRTPLHVAAERGFVDMTKLLKKALEEEMGGICPVGDNAPVDLVGRTPVACAVTSRQPSARKNTDVLRRELYGEGDKSICPVTPATERSRKVLADIRFGVADKPGWRVEMEDAILSDPRRKLFGVFDGHGDQGVVSGFLRDQFVEVWEEVDQGLEMEKRMEITCQILDTRLKRMEVKGGSTGVIGIVEKENVIVANVGDSRAILVQKGMQDGEITIVEMSTDHKPNLPNEQKRIEQAGLTVIEETCPDGQTFSKIQLSHRDKLATSRAFGDFEYKSNTDLLPDQQALICIPDVRIHERSSNDLFLILACDGIWDVMTNQECGDFVVGNSKEKSLSEVGDELLNECMKKGSMDNMSVVIVGLDLGDGGEDLVEGIKRLNFEEE